MRLLPKQSKPVAPILVTGATGYVGGRLVGALEATGHQVRCLTRQPETLAPRVQAATEIIRGDVLQASSLAPALAGIETAYYLIHSMGSGGAFEVEDRKAALNFSQAAKDAQVKRIIYLGGLGAGQDLSRHLASRHEVGEILRASGIPTIEFRAGIIIGSGSLSFEMIRALVEKLPAMIAPRWVRTRSQPIGIEDVLQYLLAGLNYPLEQHKIFEIGGADCTSYGEIMSEYADQRGLKRLMLPVPIFSPTLSSFWLELVTPLYARIGRKLINSVRNETIVRDFSASEHFHIKPVTLKTAVARALSQEDQEFATIKWSNSATPGSKNQYGGVRHGSRLIDSRSAQVKVEPTAAFKPIQAIGGKTGWYYGNSLWQLRGLLDTLVGGVGLRRGRKHPTDLAVGDILDFWRVEAIEPGLLRLRAEMKVPGRAWLQFEVIGDSTGSTIRQTAIFEPLGLFGLLYWYALYPLHQIVFAGMLESIVKVANSHSLAY